MTATGPGADDERLALLPCPFCGNNAEFGQVVADETDDNSGGHFITCTGCIVTTDLRFSRKEDARPLLAEEWNRRTAPVAGSQYLNLPPRRASDRALQIAGEAFRKIIATDAPDPAAAANAMRETARATLSVIWALTGATTGEGR